MVTATNAFTCYTSPVRLHRALQCYNGVGKDSIHCYEVTKTILYLQWLLLQTKVCLRNERKYSYHRAFLTQVIQRTFTSTDTLGTQAYCLSRQVSGRKYYNERNVNSVTLPESLVLLVSSSDLPQWFQVTSLLEWLRNDPREQCFHGLRKVLPKVEVKARWLKQCTEN